MSLFGTSVHVDPEDEASLRHDTEAVTPGHDRDDVHPPPTPPRGVESIFLSGLVTHNISATALAQQIHQRHRPISLAGTSVATDDFLSATDHLNVSNSFLESDDDPDDTPFGNDALIHSRETIVPDSPQRDRNMSTTSTTTKTNTTTESKLDPAEKIYGTAKSVWGWGKGIIIFKPFLGLAEGVAGKVVETAGSNLKDLDSALVQKLHGLDDGVLNPAIEAILGTIMGAKGKTEDFVMPILTKILSPFGLLKDKPEEESTMKPDGTVKLTVANAK